MFAPQQGLTAEEAAARIEVLKKAINQRLDNKSAANEGNASCLRKALRFSDLGATNTLNKEQWVQAFVRLGAQLSEAVGAARVALRRPTARLESRRRKGLTLPLFPLRSPPARTAARRTSSCSSTPSPRRASRARLW